VHDAAGVRSGQRGGHLGDHGDRVPPGQRPVPAEPVGDRLAVVELHDHVRHGEPVGQPGFAEVEDAGDVRVAQPGRGERLLPEPVPERVVAGELRREHLDGDVAAECLVVAAPDHRHAAGPEPLDEAVAVSDALSAPPHPPHMPIVGASRPAGMPHVKTRHEYRPLCG
jgi:hypothetical protein